MTKIILILSCLFVAYSAVGQSGYTYSVPKIEGDTQLFSSTVKKILVITLPILQNASNDLELNSLDSIGDAYCSTLVIIAAPAYEDGNTLVNKNTLKQWYRSILAPAFIITDGLNTRKINGIQQDALFRWLTDKNKNGSFYQDVAGTKSKFIVWPNGSLTCLLGVPIWLGGNVMNDLLQSQQPGENCI